MDVRKEVILAGGAIGSPHVLLASGVGPRDVLEAAGVQVNVELPGVGQHLQDHIVSDQICAAEIFTDLPFRVLKSSSRHLLILQLRYIQPTQQAW